MANPESTMAEADLAGIDRISNLPEELLCHILSFLRTEEAAATSVLSSSWRSLWTWAPDIDFRHNQTTRNPAPVQDDKPRTRLSDTINRVFILRKTPFIRSFRLTSLNEKDGCNSVNINTWVSAAIASNVEELELTLFVGSAPYLDLPRRLFTCKTLVTLKLDGHMNLDISYPVHFPWLKVLHLWHVYLGCDSCLRILSGCPVLENLSIRLADRDEQPPIQINVPSLKRLKIRSGFSSIDEFKINTPSLEYIDMQSADIDQYVLGDLKNLVEAKINKVNLYDRFHVVCSLLQAFHNVKFLSLRSVDLTIDKNIINTLHRLPVFRNLVHLKLTLMYPDFQFLITLLGHCPKLEALAILEVHSTNYRPPFLGNPTFVPDCLSSHLSVFNFKDCQGTEEELEIVAYILKNGKVLKTVTVETGFWYDTEEELRFLKELSLLPMVSKHCSLSFCIETSDNI